MVAWVMGLVYCSALGFSVAFHSPLLWKIWAGKRATMLWGFFGWLIIFFFFFPHRENACFEKSRLQCPASRFSQLNCCSRTCSWMKGKMSLASCVAVTGAAGSLPSTGV